jgi:hypothetical protein
MSEQPDDSVIVNQKIIVLMFEAAMVLDPKRFLRAAASSFVWDEGARAYRFGTQKRYCKGRRSM